MRIGLPWWPVALLVAGCSLSACGGGSTKTQARSVVELPPANPQAVEKMVRGVQAAKEPNGRDRAIALLREAILLDKQLWEARYDLGIVLASGGDLAGAEPELHAAMSISPEAQEVVIALAEVQRRRGENKAATETLGDYVQNHPQAVEAKVLYIGALRASGQIEKAIVQARELLVRKPGDASALAELALCHLAKGERDTASLLAKQALDANPKSAIAARATGLIALAEGDDAIAFQAFAKATQEDPRDTTARLNMGAVLLRAGAYGRAEEQYRAILQVSPEDNDAAVGLSAALRGQSDNTHRAKLDEARGWLEAVLKRDPHHVGALFNMGILLSDFLKRTEDAKPYFRRFLSDAPSDHPSRSEAEAHLKMKANPEAEAAAAASNSGSTSASTSSAAAPPPAAASSPAASSKPSPAQKSRGGR